MRNWRRWLREILIMVGLITAITLWQGRQLLSRGEPAPSLRVGDFDLAQLRGQRVLVYFYAPWCGVCKMSAGNLETLRSLFAEANLSFVAVALDYENQAEARQFLEEHHIPGTLVLGDPKIAQAWQIQGYPTYYLIDASGAIAHATFGYSTLPGLIVRTLLTTAKL